jgi:transposase
VAADKVFDEELGRPSNPPGVYFRMLLRGYFEGVASERGIAWRCRESLSLREFLGFDPTETSREARTQSVLMTIARTARKRHLDGVRIPADLLRAPHEIVHPALLIASG